MNLKWNKTLKWTSFTCLLMYLAIPFIYLYTLSTLEVNTQDIIKILVITTLTYIGAMTFLLKYTKPEEI